MRRRAQPILAGAQLKSGDWGQSSTGGSHGSGLIEGGVGICVKSGEK